MWFQWTFWKKEKKKSKKINNSNQQCLSFLLKVWTQRLWRAPSGPQASVWPTPDPDSLVSTSFKQPRRPLFITSTHQSLPLFICSGSPTIPRHPACPPYPHPHPLHPGGGSSTLNKHRISLKETRPHCGIVMLIAPRERERVREGQIERERERDIQGLKAPPTVTPLNESNSFCTSGGRRGGWGGGGVVSSPPPGFRPH